MDDSPHLKMQGMQCIQQITATEIYTAAVIKGASGFRWQVHQSLMDMNTAVC